MTAPNAPPDVLWLIATGNFADGWRFHGPFATADLAVEFAERNIARGEWCIAQMEFDEPGSGLTFAEPPCEDCDNGPFARCAIHAPEPEP